MAYDGKVMRAALEQFQADKQRRSSQFLERQRRIFRQVPTERKGQAGNGGEPL